MKLVKQYSSEIKIIMFEGNIIIKSKKQMKRREMYV